MGLNKGLSLIFIAALMAGVTAYSRGHPAAAEPQDPHNPLIGTWHFIGFGAGAPASPSGCSIDMTFTSTQWSQTRGGATSTISVTYIPSAKVVYVVGSDGGHITYILVDQDHIALNSWAPCTYARAG